MRHLLCAAVAAFATLIAPAVQAQGYPEKAITLVVPFAAGGPTDVVARALSVPMAKALGQTVVVEDSAGAAAAQAAAPKAAA